MSRTISKLSKPSGRDKISSSAFAYLKTRNKLRAFSFIREEFKKSGLTQADLAARLGKGTDRVCKLLGAPGNWTLDTLSEFLFAINGGIPVYSVTQPMDAPKRNDTRPHWLDNLPPPTNTGKSANIKVRWAVNDNERFEPDHRSASG